MNSAQFSLCVCAPALHECGPYGLVHLELETQFRWCVHRRFSVMLMRFTAAIDGHFTVRRCAGMHAKNLARTFRRWMECRICFAYPSHCHRLMALRGTNGKHNDFLVLIRMVSYTHARYRYMLIIIWLDCTIELLFCRFWRFPWSFSCKIKLCVIFVFRIQQNE